MPFLDKVNNTTFQTSPIVYDTQVWIAMENYKNIYITFEDAPDNKVIGSTSLMYDTLVADGRTSSTVTSQNIKSNNSAAKDGQFKAFEPNQIRTSASETANVGFRRWDKATIKIMPEPSYYIEEVSRSYSQSGTFNTILATLPESAGLLNSRDLIVDGVTQNMWIKIKISELATGDFHFGSPID